jgi:hypothetical protein
MDNLSIVQNLLSAQSTVISSSTKQISAILQGGAAVTQELLRQKKGKETNQNKANKEKDKSKSFRKTSKAATSNFIKIILCQHLYAQISRLFRMQTTLFLKTVNTRGAKGALHVKCHTLTSFMNSSGDLPCILLKT